MNQRLLAVAVLLTVVAGSQSAFSQSQITNPPVTGTFTAQGGVNASFKFNPAPASNTVVSGVNRSDEFVLYDVSHADKGLITLYLLAPPSKRMGTDFYFEILIRQDQAFSPGTYDFETFKGRDPETLKGTLFAAVQPQPSSSGGSPPSWSAANYASPPTGKVQAQVLILDGTTGKVKHAHITGSLVSGSGAPPVSFTLSY
jgi:hypothetical protein